MMKRFIWNPHWNESLFLVSCAERLSQNITPEHSTREILTRLKRDLQAETDAPQFRFRVAFIHREDETLTQEILYTSAPEPLA